MPRRTALDENSMFSVSLNSEAGEGQSPKSSISPFRLKDSSGDNFATHVEKLTSGIRIHGINCKGVPRFITINNNGECHGFHVGKPLGIVEKQLFENREAICRHFGVSTLQEESRSNPAKR